MKFLNLSDFSFYIIAPLILVLAFLIIRQFLRLIFEAKKIRWTHPNSIVNIANTFIFLAFMSLTNFWIQLIGELTKTINNNWKIEIQASEYADLYNIIMYIVFCIAVSRTLHMYYEKKKHMLPISETDQGPRTQKKEDSQQEENKSSRKQILENFKLQYEFASPPKVSAESPFFHKRIKELFELKFRYAEFIYDGEFKTLFGSYGDGLHNYTLLVYCQETITKYLKITLKRQQQIFDLLREQVSANLPLSMKGKGSTIKCFYIIERGHFQSKLPGLICKNEDDVVNELVNFKPYLNSIIFKYANESLPFSTSNKRYTLSDTFVSPTYNKHNENLEEYLDIWLNNKNNMHIAVLGDYGMGKTSFLKYYAQKLAKQIIEGGKVIRYPVFISLTNTSPMHEGIRTRCESFVSMNLGVNYDSFKKLINKGKIVFLLDGFDEMGFIGSKRQRHDQFDAIWQLATKNNKLIISGRPSYFPSEEDLIRGLKIKDYHEIPSEVPFCRRIELDEFDSEKIKQSFAYYYKDDELSKYLNFIKSNKSILDLCKRPSMLHIVREMVPVLFRDFKQNRINAGTIMDQYIDHWIDRQLEKGIISMFRDNSDKKEFLKDFFIDLAGSKYKPGNGNAIITLYEIRNLIKLKSEKFEEHLLDRATVYHLKYARETEAEIRMQEVEGDLGSPSLHDMERREEQIKELYLPISGQLEELYDSLESEIITGYFIEREQNHYKFVHKSFFEYLTSLSIIKKLKYSSIVKIGSGGWTKEIKDFIYESKALINLEDHDIKIPILLQLSGKNLRRLNSSFVLFKVLLSTFHRKYEIALALMIIIFFLFFVFGLSLSKISIILGLYFLILGLEKGVNDGEKIKATDVIKYSKGEISKYLNLIIENTQAFRNRMKNWQPLFTLIILFVFALHILIYTSFQISEAIPNRSSLESNSLNNIQMFILTVKEMYDSFVIHNISYFLSLVPSRFIQFFSAVLKILLFFITGIIAGSLFERRFNLHFLARVYHSENQGYNQKIPVYFEILRFAGNQLSEEVVLKNFSLSDRFFFTRIRFFNLKGVNISSFKIIFKDCRLDDIDFRGCYRIRIISSEIRNLKFQVEKYSLLTRVLFKLELKSIELSAIDSNSLKEIKSLIERNKFSFGKQIICADDLKAKILAYK